MQVDSVWGNRSVMKLLSGEILGALGVQVFNLTVVYHLVKTTGASGAYYLAGLLFGTLLSAVLGAGLFDRFHPFLTAATLNGIRVAAVPIAILVVVSGLPGWVLIAACLGVSAARPHLDAAIFGGLLTLRLGGHALQRSTALVDNTARLARIVGPGLTALITLLGSEVYALGFALTCFLMAGLLLLRVDAALTPAAGVAAEPQAARTKLLPALTRGFNLAARSPALVYCFASQGVNAGVWYLGFVFSTALLFSAVGDAPTAGLGGFGIVSLCYGFGNVFGNVVTGSLRIERPMHFVVGGRLLCAFGYVLLAFDVHFFWLCACAALSGIGTPPSDLATLKILQTTYPWDDVAKLHRVSLVSEYAGMLIAMLLAPVLLQFVSPHGVIASCGIVLLLCGLVGLSLLPGRIVSAEGKAGAATPAKHS